jgi:antitoxin PrlF
MKRSSKISSKGQVTIPLEIRQRLGLRAGDRVEFVTENGRTIIRPERPAQNPFAKYVGALPAFSSVREINAWVRSLRDEKTARNENGCR